MKVKLNVQARPIPPDELIRRAERACSFLWTMGFITDQESAEIGRRIREREEWPEGRP